MLICVIVHITTRGISHIAVGLRVMSREATSRRKITIQQMTLVDEDTVPLKQMRKSEEWIRLLKQIPPGKAWVFDRETMGVSGSTIKILVARYVQSGRLPKSYRVSQRTIDGKTKVYVINSAKQDT